MLRMNRKFFGDGFTLRILTVVLFSALTVAGMAFSVYLFLVASNLYMYLLAVAFFALSALSSFFNISASVLYYRSYFYMKHLQGIEAGLKPVHRKPSIAIAVPVYNEDVGVVEATLESMLKLNYPKDKLRLYLLDDSTKPEIRSALESYSAVHGITFLHRDDRKGFKAGALNNMLKYIDEEFLAIFDYDEKIVNPEFLNELLPFFGDLRVSYVQTEKTRSRGSLFSETVNVFDGFFFKFIEPARALNNTAIFAGSCGLIRTSILKKLHGFPEYVIEDTFFSFESDRNNYKSIFVPKVYAVGSPIRTFTELAKQQWRYNYGDTQFIGYFLKRKSSVRSSPLSRMDYITHGLGLNYISVVLIFFTIISIFIVFSSVPIAHLTLHQILSTPMTSLDLEFIGSVALLMSILTPIMLTKLYFGSAKKGVLLFALNYALAFVRAKAAIAALMHSNPLLKWNRENTTMGSRLIMSLRNTKLELLFAFTVLSSSTMAAIMQNLTGSLWLFGYGVMYLLTTAFLYKYG